VQAARSRLEAHRGGHTREQIAACAIAIADAEGLEAVSMRRIARELGAGTMTLYHYVLNKDDLFSLMDDAIMGEVLVPPGELPDQWRAALTAIAHHTRAAFSRHPWSFEGLRNARGGPNSLRHFEQSIGVVAATGLDQAGQLELLTLIDDYVFGFVMRERQLADFDVEQELQPHTVAFIEQQLATGELPNVARFAGGDPMGGFARFAEMARDPGRFDRGLAQLLDGVELDLAGRLR
jgi:AcrR family transcriptional regulator